MARGLSSAGRASALQAEGHRFEPYRPQIFAKNMARWLNWLERPVHTREVESSSLSLAIYNNPRNLGVRGFLFVWIYYGLITKSQTVINHFAIKI